MSTRAARAGLFAMAGAHVLGVARDVYLDRLFANLDSHGGLTSDVTLQLEVLDYVWYAVTAATMSVAFVVAGALPREVRARGIVSGIGAMSLVQLVIHASQRALFQSANSASIKTISIVTWACSEAITLGATILTGIAIFRIGRAANASRARTVALVATVPLLLLLLPGIVNTVRMNEGFPPTIQRAVGVLFDVAAFVQAGALVWTGRLLARLPETEARATDATGKLAPEWRRVMGGLYTYLGAAVVRIVVALFSFLTVSSAGAETYESYTAMHGLHDSVITLGFVGGFFSLVMMGGVFALARAPVESVRQPAFAALFCMVLGLALDAVTTYLTAGAFTSVSAAFTAMDALPFLAAFGSGLAVFGAWSLLRALAAAGDEIGVPAVAARARTTAPVLLIAGGIGAVAQLAVKSLPSSLAIATAALVVPVLLFAAVQLVRVMLGIASSIQERADL